ncbi:transglutaminaseTgpA domain-containing protein [Aeromonas diversa]|uniref:transglutaminase family protein n=1 Tax=Aeromonas diversa TaxID=502790 RepID=UPI0039A33EBB
MMLESRRLWLLALLLQLPLLLALWPYLHGWVVLAILACQGWRGLTLWRGWPSPARYLRLLLTFAALALLLLGARGSGLLATLINLLCLAYGLKFLELSRERDMEPLLVVIFFLIALSLIERQSLPWALLLGAVYLLAIAALVLACWPQGQSPQKPALLALLLAFPLQAGLFLLLPRLPPLWQVPQSHLARSGLSERVAAGEIGSLLQSGELAFRVTFGGALPLASERYFPVLRQEWFDGDAWQLAPPLLAWRRKQWPQPVTATVAGPPGSDEYEIIAEPQQLRWLPALENPVPRSGPVQLSPANTLYRLDDGSQRIGYRVTRGGQARADEQVRRRNLQLPSQGNPMARELARQWQGEPPTHLAERLLELFARGGFAYTLTPPLLGADPVDGFLFTQRRGFCAHYASAAAFLLRAAGIPARLVSGYQGGEWNPQGEYLALYQYDAHAWVEYLDEQGKWQRLDPTAVVAPERLTGAEEAGQGLLSPLRYRQLAWLTPLRLWWASVDYHWSRWVLNYDASTLWQRLTTPWPSLRRHLPWLILGGLTLFSLPLLLLLHDGEGRVARPWRPLLRRAARRELAPLAGESLPLWCERLAERLPELGHPLRRCAWLHRRLHYAPLSTRQRGRTARALKRRLRQVARNWSAAIRGDTADDKG